MNTTDLTQWPKVGSKVKFKGTPAVFWFQNIIKDANDLLELGKEYTISKLRLNSSWCSVVLEEFPDHKFSLSFFEYEKTQTTNEVRRSVSDPSETAKHNV